MSADFDAGSIEGTLDLNTRPFANGLRVAREQARRFREEEIDPSVGLDQAGFQMGSARVQEKLREIDNTHVEASADLNIGQALAKAQLLKHTMRGLDAGGLGGALTGPSLSAGKIVAMAGALLSVAAAAGPATAAVAGFGAAAGVALGGAGIAFALFGASVKSAFGEIAKANKEGVTLTGAAGKAQEALKGLTAGWKKLQDTVKPEMFRFLAATFSGLTGILPKLAPLLKTMATGMTGVVTEVFKVTKSPAFDRFLKTLRQFMEGFLNGMGPVLANLLRTFMSLFVALQPLMSMLGKGIMEMSDAMGRFSERLDKGGAKPFIEYMRKVLPQLRNLVVDLAEGFGGLARGIAPLAGPALSFIGALVKAVGSLDLKPFAEGFAAVLTAAEPLLDVLGSIINVVLKPLGTLLKTIADSAIAPIAMAMKDELVPAFERFGDTLNVLAKPLGEFIASIANLINPTGIAIMVSLLDGLGSVLSRIGPPILAFATEIEGLIDKGLEAALPYLDRFFVGLDRLLNPTSKLNDMVGGRLKAAFDSIRPGLREIAGHLEGLGRAALALWPAVSKLATGLASSLLPAFTQIGQFLVNELIPTLLGVYEWFATKILPIIVDSLTPVLIALGDAFSQKIVPGLIKVWVACKPLIPVLEDVAEVVFKVAGFIVKHWWPILVKVAGFLLGGFFSALAGIITMFIKYGAEIVKGGKKMYNFYLDVRDAVSKVVTWFKKVGTGAKGIYEDVKKWLGNVVDWCRKLPGKIKDAFSGLGSAISGPFTTAFGAIKSLWNSTVGGFGFSIPSWVPKVGGKEFHIPEMFMGGVTNGEMIAKIGDNVGGKEAVIPLDKYDIPKKGEMRASERLAADQNSKMIDLLGLIAQRVVGKDVDPDEFAEALARVLGKQTEAQMKTMVQLARSA